MLELIITVLPGILAFLIYRYTHQEFHCKKLLSYILFYTIFANLSILIGLKLIGMQSFNLSAMSTGFKVKWILLEVLLSAWLTWVIRNIRKTNPVLLKQILQRLFPVTLFFLVTYAVFTPSSLFLGNIDEFSLHYTNIIPAIFCTTLLLFIGIYSFALWLIREKSAPFFIALIFSITIAAYVQGNFLNASLPILDGTLLDWKTFGIETIISTLFWILCIASILIAAYLKREKCEKVIKYISYFLSAVQLLSLAMLIVMNPLDDDAAYGFSKEGEFTVGSKENIIIFIIDTLQADVMKEYLLSDAYGTDGSLDDFTFFDNAVSGGAPTSIAMPLLMTGSEYDPAQPMEDYLKEAWAETSLYNDLHQKGYDIRVFSTPHDLAEFPEGTFDNYNLIGSSWIDDYLGFGKSMYQVVNYLLMPQCLKESFWTSTDTLLYHIKNDAYQLNDIYFYNDFAAANDTLQSTYDKAFRLYHFNGLHPPYSMTPYFDRVWSFGVSEQSVLQGDMKIIYTYLNELKRAGVYDNSTIIITGDHGRHTYDNPESNPAFLIKMPSETHALTLNSAPIHFRNIAPTLASTILDDYSAYGPSIYDITQESDVERLHTVDDSIMKRNDLQYYDTSLKCGRLIISGNAADFQYQLWNPYEINRIDYPLGGRIDFSSPNEYASQLHYRLYQENGTATASNELTLCFDLQDYENEDLTFHFVYSSIYNASQKIRFYAGGNRIETIICTKNDSPKEVIVSIPKESIQDDLLSIRMVFPNAVTPNQLDRANQDMRVLSVVFDSMWLE